MDTRIKYPKNYCTSYSCIQYIAGHFFSVQLQFSHVIMNVPNIFQIINICLLKRYWPMRKEVGWKWHHSTGLALSYSRWDFQKYLCNLLPVRGLNLFSEPFLLFEYNTCYCLQHGINIGLRLSSHIICTMYTELKHRCWKYLPLTEKTVRIRSQS